MTADDPTRTPPSPLRRARLTFVLVAVVLPIVISAIGVVVLVAWLPSMPDQVAIHWGVDGADGFGPASTYVWILLGVGLVLPVLMAIITLAAVGAQWGGAARLMGALAAGMAAFATVLSLGSLAMQRDLAAGADVPGIGLVLAGSFAALAAVGAAAWAVQPQVRPESGPTLEPRQAVRIAEGERVVWLATTSMPRAAVSVLLLLLLALVALAAFMLGTGVQGGWVVAVVVVIVASAMVATTAFRVRVTPEGFAARALIGWPRITIPLDEVESARAVDVSPFGEFGGWGWRIGLDGRTGIVTRRGSAIEVERRGRPPFLVTIDGAEEAAALLQTFVDRARPHGAPRTDQGKATS